MRPETLCCTIRRSPNPLILRPAFLPNYRRCRINKCNYPAIIPVERPDIGMANDDKGVIGVFAEGLSDQDLTYLDEWEGDVSPHRLNLLDDVLSMHSAFPRALIHIALIGIHSSACGHHSISLNRFPSRYFKCRHSWLLIVWYHHNSRGLCLVWPPF